MLKKEIIALQPLQFVQFIGQQSVGIYVDQNYHNWKPTVDVVGVVSDADTCDVHLCAEIYGPPRFFVAYCTGCGTQVVVHCQ